MAIAALLLVISPPAIADELGHKAVSLDSYSQQAESGVYLINTESDFDESGIAEVLANDFGDDDNDIIPNSYLVPHSGKCGGESPSKAAVSGLGTLPIAKADPEERHRALVRELNALRHGSFGIQRFSSSAQSGDQPKYLKQLSVSTIPFISDAEKARLEKLFCLVPDQLAHVTLEESVPLIGADHVWEELDSFGLNVDGDGIRVGVIDTGIDYTHEAFGSCTSEQHLAGNCAAVPVGYDFTTDTRDGWDDGYHGTHVAATIAGRGAVKGVAPGATVFPLKVCYGSGSCPFSAILGAIDWAMDPDGDGRTDDHLDVINLSLGSRGDPDDTLSSAIDAAVEAGIVAVISAGNSGARMGTIGSPGTARKAVTVGAAFKEDLSGYYWGDNNPHAFQPTGFSSRGYVIWGNDKKKILKPDILGPGAFICAAQSNSALAQSKQSCAPGRVSLSGTSMSSPHVAGIAALIRQAHPTWEPIQVKHAIRNTAELVIDPDTQEAYEDYEQGYGHVNAYDAVMESNDPIVAEIYAEGLVDGARAPILGRVTGSGFTHYQLQIRRRAGDSWEVVSEGEEPVAEGPVGRLNTYDWTELHGSGEYELRLQVFRPNDTPIVSKGYINLIDTLITAPAGIKEHAGIDARTLYPASEPIQVTGTVKGPSSDHFTLEWCPTYTSTLNPVINECSMAGVTMTNGGYAVVINGPLGSIDFSQVSNFESGFYAIRLTHYRVGEEIGSDIEWTTIYVDTQLLPSYPRRFEYYSSGPFTLSLLKQPVMFDVNGDGASELVYAYGNRLAVHDGLTFDPLPGWPVTLPNEGYAQTAPNVFDADGDGDMEILATYIEQPNGSYQPMVGLYHHDGTIFDGWPMRNYARNWWGSPRTVIDLNLDGLPELISHDLKTFDVNGDEPFGWDSFSYGSRPRDQGNLWAQGIAAAIDYPETNDPDMVSTAGDEMPFVVGVKADNGEQEVIAFKADGSPRWRRSLEFPDGSLFSDPTLVDLNNDGKLDVVFASIEDPWGQPLKRVHGYLHDGTIPQGFPYALPRCTDGYYCSGYPTLHAVPVAAADMDFDGFIELAVLETPQSTYSGIYEYPMHCIHVLTVNEEGAAQQKARICDNPYERFTFNYSLSIANVDADPELELIPALSGLTGRCYADGFSNCVSWIPAYNLDGTFALKLPTFTIPLNQNPAVGNVTNIGNDPVNSFMAVQEGKIYVWKLNACASSPEEWGQHGGNDEAGSFRRTFQTHGVVFACDGRTAPDGGGRDDDPPGGPGLGDADDEQGAEEPDPSPEPSPTVTPRPRPRPEPSPTDEPTEPEDPIELELGLVDSAATLQGRALQVQLEVSANDSSQVESVTAQGRAFIEVASSGRERALRQNFFNLSFTQSEAGVFAARVNLPARIASNANRGWVNFSLRLESEELLSGRIDVREIGSTERDRRDGDNVKRKRDRNKKRKSRKNNKKKKGRKRARNNSKKQG